MYRPEIIAQTLLDGFYESSFLALFRDFLMRRQGVTKWMIVSDYCLHDPSRPEDAIAFSIVPYDDWLPDIMDRLRSALPRDIKSTTNIPKATIEYLRQPHLFHIGIVLDKHRSFFTNGPGSNELIIARESIKLDSEETVAKGRDAGRIARIKSLQQASLANGFNVSLMSDLALLAVLYPFVSLLLVRESKPTII